MKIGLTYDLRSEYLAAGYTEDETAEFDRESTVEGLENALHELGHQPVRIGHARQLMRKLVAGEEWDLVLNIAEGMCGIAREAQVPAILDVYGIPYVFSDPLVLALTLHKGLTKVVVRDGGVLTPDFALVEKLSDIERINLPYPLFAKPVAEGTGKGVSPKSKAKNLGELRQVCADLLKTYQQPVIVETFLPGREFTIGFTGTGDDAKVIGTIEVLLLANAEPEVYSYTNKEYCEDRVTYKFVRPSDDPVIRDAEAIALKAWKILGCRDGGRMDLRCDAAGSPNFLEVNPLAGMHPEHSDLPILSKMAGVSYLELMRRIVESAIRRIETSPPSKAKWFGKK